jgi:outer membrane murein-binding lipoprotein Lpp
MHKAFKQKLLVVLLAGMSLPLAASASEADLMKKIDALSAEIQALRNQVKANEEKTAKTDEKIKAVTAKADTGALDELKGQVKKLEDKSLGKWLTVGGDYRFRYDNLDGQTKPFTDVTATFANAQSSLQAAFFGGSAVAGANLAGLMGFAQGMAGVSTFSQARAFLVSPAAAAAAALPAFAVTVPAYKAKNASLWTNRFGLDLSAKATQDISVTTRLLMYKTFGSQNDGAVTNAGNAPFFADRVGVFDGTLGHVPSSSYLNVDRAFATWSNILDQEMWFSVGRRPSTNGAPSNLRLNNPRPGNGGTPSLLVDYAFDGMTLGYAPEIDALPGAYGKICYGRGFESGFDNPPGNSARNPTGNSLKDTDMIGIAIIPIDTDPLRVWLQWNRGMNIFDAPTMNNTYFGNTMAKANLGDIDWYGIGFMSTFKKVGPGELNIFADWGMSKTHPNDNVSAQFGFQGLMTGAFLNPEAPTSKTGTAVAMGVRYDLPSKTKLGFEYNHGSKDWITFAPAADDMWTAKVGTRGNVYEAYLIQELDKQPISSYFSRAFFRLGVQRYDFKYTGSNNWVGAPVKISDVTAANMMTTTPLEHATNLYATFEVKF